MCPLECRHVFVIATEVADCLLCLFRPGVSSPAAMPATSFARSPAANTDSLFFMELVCERFAQSVRAVTLSHSIWCKKMAHCCGSAQLADTLGSAATA